MRDFSRILLVLVLAHALGEQVAMAGPIYVFKEPDGSIHFTNHPPPPGISAKVFEPKKPGFSIYRVGKGWRASGRLFRHEYSDIVSRWSHEFGVEPSFVRAVIHAESAFNPHAVSPMGARGLMQLMPAIAAHLGVRNSFSPDENIRGGVKHLAYLLRRYDGDKRLALAAYNAGEDDVERYKGVPPFAETKEYVRRILDLERRYRTDVGGGEGTRRR
jgi:soluble lytic murein transglycosylase-like protein